MRIDDLRQLDDGTRLEADVCIVGTGPAGWTIADELSGSGLRVLMLESGGLDEEPEVAALNRIRDLGTPTFNGRTRALGGTSRTWFGRCIPLGEIDLEERSWVPSSGWPLSADELKPYVVRAAERLGASLWSGDGPPPPPGWPAPLPEVDRTRLSRVWWQDTVPLDAGAALARDRVGDAHVLLHATVTQLHAGPHARALESVEVACAPDHRATIRARAAILCAGGIENARILLCSDRVSPGGLGNGHDLVGRHLIDHPRDPTIPVRVARGDEAAFRGLFGPHRLAVAGGERHGFRLGFAVSAELQRREGLLNAAAIVERIESPRDPVPALLRLRDRDLARRRSDARQIAGAPIATLRALRAMARDEPSAGPVEALGFELISEQVPDPESRVRLGRERDRLGLPVAEVDWRVHELERRSQAALAREIATALPRLGLSRPALAAWLTDRDERPVHFTDGCHPAGTTRMARDPRRGVVDPDCMVHGIENLYVAGSSVFPTAGHANPTLAIVALAIRLADRIRATIGPRRAAARRAEPATVVTGATGFIGGRLTRALLDAGGRVRCPVRDGGERRLPAGAEPVRVDMRSPSAVHAAIEGARTVFHCAYDFSSEAWNEIALRRLIDACARRGARLVHLSSFMVYDRSGSGARTEQAPYVSSGEGYPAVKRALEAEIRRAVREQGLDASILQPTNVYGPFSRLWTERPADMLRFGTVVLPEPGDGRVSLVHVDDVVAALLAAGRRKEAAGATFILDGADTPSWRVFYEAVAAAIGIPGPELRPVAEIRRESRLPARLGRLARDPVRLARALWLTSPGRRALEHAIGRLPLAARHRLTHFLEEPSERWRGIRHLPDLEFTLSKATFSSERARRELGFSPRRFAAGMADTGPYLERYVRFGPPR